MHNNWKTYYYNVMPVPRLDQDNKQISNKFYAGKHKHDETVT